MSRSSSAEINTFPISAVKTDNAQPDEQIFVLSSRQLQDIIEKVTEPLLERIMALEGIVASQSEKIAALETLQLQDIDRISFDIAQDRQRIKKLEDKPVPTETPLIDELYKHMRSVGLKQTTFAGAAKILDVTRGRIHQLKPMIALDPRFIIMPSESHKQRLLIRLREAKKF